MSASVLASSQGITSAYLMAVVNKPTPFASDSIDGTWGVQELNGGCDGAAVSGTGGQITFSKPGLYNLHYQVKMTLPATIESTAEVGGIHLVWAIAGGGEAFLQSTGYADMTTGGSGVAQEVAISGGGLVSVSTVPLTIIPSYETPTGCAGGVGSVIGINADYSNFTISRVA